MNPARAKCPVSACPKCGEPTFDGPRYRHIGHQHGVNVGELLWTCNTCRWVATASPLDAIPAPSLDDFIDRL